MFEILSLGLSITALAVSVFIFYRFKDLGWGRCHHCNKTWRRVEGHVTLYTEGSGCFPLCVGCWAKLGSPEARLPYYRELWEEWNEGGERGLAEWDQIEAAVRDGK